MKRYKPGSYYLRLWEGHREGGVQPFRLAHRKSHGVVIVDARGRVHSALCLRGNSKQRRQQMREALRYLNAPVPELVYVGDPRQLSPIGQVEEFKLSGVDFSGGVISIGPKRFTDEEWNEQLDPHSRFKR